MLTHLKEFKSWPFEEASKLLRRFFMQETLIPPSKGYVLFETGYGASGLPHIGTFGEVARTLMVSHAFSILCQKEKLDLKTRLFTISDDMDGLRKVPDNIPNQDLIREHLGKPLTQVPDPFGCCESFGAHNNQMLKRFLDSFGFDYEFKSSTQCYKNGVFDETLKLVLAHYDDIMSILLTTLREERQKTYAPFLPICPRTGVVLQVPIEKIHLESNTIVYKDPKNGNFTEVSVLGGHCKLQWKIDWGMRWKAFDVDYEMSGKDLIDSVKISSKICRLLGGRAPENLCYEHFLDEKGGKISKSKGNGLTIDQWLRYAPQESVSYYMYQTPKRAKRLYFDVIPKSVDDYLLHLQKYSKNCFDNPVYHVHKGEVPSFDTPITFTLLLNLASACHAESREILEDFVNRYLKEDVKYHPFLSKLIDSALNYYQDFVAPHKVYRNPTSSEKDAILDLYEKLQKIDPNSSPEELQNLSFSVGKKYFSDLKAWFSCLYEVLLGQKEGPRLGSFIKIYGVNNMYNLIKERLNL